MRTRGKATLVALTAAVALGAVAATVAISSGAPARKPSAAVTRYLGRVGAATPIEFGLTLRMDTGALERYAASVRAGREPPLSAAQVGRRFGISSGRLGRALSWLSAHGVRVQEAFPQRTQLLVSAPAARVESMLGVSLGEFTDSRGAHYYRPLSPPTIPAALRAAVVGATQLNSRRIPMNLDVPEGGMTASDLESLYDIRPLVDQGLDGSGQTVAVFSGDTFNQSDINAFDAEHNISGAPPVQKVEIQGGQVPFQGGDPAVEVDLDIEVIQELAPRAQIVNYELQCCTINSFSVGIDKIVADGRAKLVNFSYGACEALFGSSLPGQDQSFAAAAAAGVTVFAASGDAGSYACQRQDPTNHSLGVSWPGSSPNVLSVGGTYVDLRQDGTRLDEAGWEQPLELAGGGGGLSMLFARPSWQTGVAGIDNQYSNGKRQVPDVAAAASADSGYSIVSQGQNVQEGGTSAAAPLWTGSFVLIDELARRQLGHLLPFIAPLLYRAAARDPSAFYDVTFGGNRFYSAGPGWDYATGIGTPDMAVLARDVIALAR